MRSRNEHLSARSIEVNGADLNYDEHGVGRPRILIHGGAQVGTGHRRTDPSGNVLSVLQER
jgi:hypothetical protein